MEVQHKIYTYCVVLLLYKRPSFKIKSKSAYAFGHNCVRGRHTVVLNAWSQTQDLLPRSTVDYMYYLQSRFIIKSQFVFPLFPSTHYHLLLTNYLWHAVTCLGQGKTLPVRHSVYVSLTLFCCRNCIGLIKKQCCKKNKMLCFSQSSFKLSVSSWSFLE